MAEMLNQLLRLGSLFDFLRFRTIIDGSEIRLTT